MSPSRSEIPSFVNEAGRLRSFTPPFAFSAFFSPEDTLLCVCASEKALDRIDIRDPRIAELTTGSGLVGLTMLQRNQSARLVAMDVEASAVSVATSNAVLLGLADRARFVRADLWSSSTLEMLRSFRPSLLICNPPYIPEPPGGKLEIEAGAGADGTAHLERTLELAYEVRPEMLTLSWCSLSDPAKVISRASRAGYCLDALFIVAIADGEYSGLVHDYLRSLPSAFINESPETLKIIASDGSARFVYLLMSGVFSARTDPEDRSGLVRRICEQFVQQGLSSLEEIDARIPVEAWILNRWGELELRAILHGPVPDENTRHR